MAPYKRQKAPRARKRRSAFPADVETIIGQLVGTTLSASAIHNVLKAAYPDADIPAERTIDRRLKSRRASDDDIAWTFSAETEDDAPFVLPVLAELHARGARWSKRLTRSQGEWIGRIVRAVPDVPPGLALSLADSALAGEIEPISAVLAFAPWRDDDRAREYTLAARAGRLPEPKIGGYLQVRDDHYEIHEFIALREGDDPRRVRKFRREDFEQ